MPQNNTLTTAQPTPGSLGFRQPAEWETHESVWLAWPSHAELWEENLSAAQDEFTAFAEAIADLDANGKPRGETLNVLLPFVEAQNQAEKALRGLPVKFHAVPFGDIWLRDTAPVFLSGPGGARASVRFQFNGWGEKYILEHDAQVSTRVAAIAHEVSGITEFVSPWILEGGSVEVDGLGTCLTSRQCLLNPNRNARMGQSEIERRLGESLGTTKTLWIGDGLINDHTDGHIDTIARFAQPGVILCMKANSSDDPNKAIMEQIERDLAGATDARGEKIRVGLIPSPGTVVNDDGRLMPASYLNFYIANTTVIVPTYGSHYDQTAVEAIAEWFPGRRTIGLSAKAILSGGGAFHCISQQQPQPKGTP